MYSWALSGVLRKFLGASCLCSRVLRFLRHVPVIYVDYPGSLSLKQIYGTFNRAMLRLVPNLRAYSDPLTDAMVEFYTLSQVRAQIFRLKSRITSVSGFLSEN